MMKSRYTSRVPVYLSHKWSHMSGTIICDVEPQIFGIGGQTARAVFTSPSLGPGSPLHLTIIVTYEDP